MDKEIGLELTGWMMDKDLREDRIASMVDKAVRERRVWLAGRAAGQLAWRERAGAGAMPVCGRLTCCTGAEHGLCAGVWC